MRSQRNKKCVYNQKFIKGIKITVNTVIELTYKVFNYMHKDSYLLFERFGQNSLETFANNILLELEKITFPSMSLVMPTLFETK